MMDTHGAASGAITAQAVADGDTVGRPELDLDELRKAEAERRRTLDNLPVLSWRGLPDGSKDSFSRRWHEWAPEPSRCEAASLSIARHLTSHRAGGSATLPAFG
jgi:hypothetical protein